MNNQCVDTIGAGSPRRAVCNENRDNMKKSTIFNNWLNRRGLDVLRRHLRQIALPYSTAEPCGGGGELEKLSMHNTLAVRLYTAVKIEVTDVCKAPFP
jgi:hypothetical protein